MRHEFGLQSPAWSAGSQKRLYDQAARLAHIGGWECELATERLNWTEGVYDMFGLSVGAPLKRSEVLALYTDESRRDVETLRNEAIRTGRGFVLDTHIRTAGRESRWLRLSLDVGVEDGTVVRIFGAKQDITEERAAWLRLRRLAERDPLTGLANRGLFEAHYRDISDDPLNRGFASALVLVDVDHFKAINDCHGHAAGDECLRQIAVRLDKLFSDALVVARIGGDEFAVLMRRPCDPSRIAQVLNLALTALRQPVIWGGRRLEIGVSIGARLLRGPHVGRIVGDVYAEADAALYAAKAAGRSTVRIFGETPRLADG